MQAVNKFRKQGEVNIQKETGHFVPVESRKEVAQELKRSHFVLGSDKSDFRSKNEIQQQDQNWNIDQDKSKFGMHIKQSHVQIGFNNKFAAETTNQQDYNKKSVDLARVAAAKEAKQDLRKSHFNFGSNQTNDIFTTTNMERFRKSSYNLTQTHLSKVKAENTDRSNIICGSQKPDYQSSMKQSMVTHDLAQSYRNLQQQHERGQNLRKHNFHLGYDKNPGMESEYASFMNEVPRSKSLAGPAFKASDVKRSNIELGSKWENNDYQSIMKMSQETTNASVNQKGANLNPAEQASKAQTDLRKSHFTVGTAPMVLESSAKGAFKNMENDGASQKEKQQIQSKMQKGNFSIAHDKNRSLQFETTYKGFIANDNKAAVQSLEATDMRKHLSGSINLGSHQIDFQTEAKSKQLYKLQFIYRFIGQQAERDNAYKNMIDKNRNPHFKFGDGTSQQLTTVMKSQFDYKGNPIEIRQTLDESKKADLKQHHFQMGSHNTEYKTSSLKANANDQGNQNFKIEAKSLLKNSGQRIFGGNASPQKATGEYQTTNQSFIKWIQPAPSQMELSMGGPQGKQ